jgi:hypothetical protein
MPETKGFLPMAMPTEEEQVDALLEAFNLWFQSLPNEPLVKAELAVTKSFCFYLSRIRNTMLPGVVAVAEEKKQ